MKKLTGEKINYILGTILLMFSVGSYLLSAKYIVPASDDFSYTDYIMGFGGHTISGVSKLVRMYYHQFQGVFFGIAIEGFIDPMNRIGWENIGIILWIAIILFVFTFLVIIYSFTKKCCQNKSVLYLLTALWITIVLNIRVMKELLLWFTGACDYTIPIMTGLLGGLCLMKYNNDAAKVKKAVFLTASVLLVFLTGGGSLQIAGFFCWVYLLYLGWSILKKSKIKTAIIVFISSFMGALVNVAAPGNYVRKSNSYEGISLVKAAYYAVVAVGNEIKRIFSSTYIPLLLLLIVIFLFIYGNAIEEKLFHPMIVGIAVVGGWVISTFPVCYGYGDSSLAERGYETLDIFIVLGLMLFVNSFVGWAKGKGIFLTRENIITIGIMVVIFSGYLQSSLAVFGLPSIQGISQALSGELKAYHKEWNRILTEIENSDDTIVEVAVPKEIYEADLILMGPNLSENPEKWTNYSLAHLYGKEQVKLKIIDDN